MANGIPGLSGARTRLRTAAKGAQQKRDASQSIISALGFLVDREAKDKELVAAQEENRLNRENRLEVAKLQTGRGFKPESREEALQFFTREAIKNNPGDVDSQRLEVNANINAFDRTKKGLTPFPSEKEIEDLEPEGAFTKGLKAIGIAGKQAANILASPVEVLSDASRTPDSGSGVIESLLRPSSPRSPQIPGDSILPGDISPDAANATFAAPATSAVPGIGLPSGLPDVPGLSDNKSPVSRAEFNFLVKQHGQDVINAQFKVAQ